jgi:hypothetical protein
MISCNIWFIVEDDRGCLGLYETEEGREQDDGVRIKEWYIVCQQIWPVCPQCLFVYSNERIVLQLSKCLKQKYIESAFEVQCIWVNYWEELDKKFLWSLMFAL